MTNESNQLIGYPSIDKPWLKYYTDEQINSALPNCSLYEYLWECNMDHLDNYALNYFGNKITYRKLFSMIDEAAKAFIAVGVKEKEVVPIVSISTVTSVVCFYALNRIGAVADYLNVLSEERDFQRYFEEVNAKVVVTLDLFGKKVVGAAQKTGVKTIITFGVNREMPAIVNFGYKLKSNGKLPAIPPFDNLYHWDDFIGKGKGITDINKKKSPEETCLIAHTGGTTGDPKAVMLSDKAMNAVACEQRSIYIKLPENKNNGTFLHVMVPFVVYGILTCTHMPLCMGWCLAIIPKYNGEDWHKYIKKYAFDYTFAVPAYISQLANNRTVSKMDLSAIKIVAAGGDGLTETFEHQMNSFFTTHGSKTEMYKGYGLSEICAAGLVSFPKANRLGSVGIPLPQNNVMIFDNDSDTELSYNQVGEVCLQAPSLMLGYWENEEETKQIIRLHNGNSWLHSGDLGYIDEDGFLFLVGRMKRVILTSKDGIVYKVYPSVPQKIIHKHNLVKHCCIVGAKNGEDQVLRAYIVVSGNELTKSAVIEKEIRKICDEQLPSYSRPTFYVFRESLPLTAAGKVDYRALEDEAK